MEPEGEDRRLPLRPPHQPLVLRDVNDNFRGEWYNTENIGVSIEELIAQWNEAHPDDPVES